jgi:RNase P subunit RPR2
MPPRRIYPRKGARFGSRVVLRRTSHGSRGESRVEVLCECGDISRVPSTELRHGRLNRCGSCAAKKRMEAENGE